MRRRWKVGALTLAIGALVSVAAAHAAQSPFGIATPDATGAGFGGPLSPFFAWIALYQARFYRALTLALGGLREDLRGLWLLLGLSFAYGVFHAVGPGHGKAVISSYLVASGDSVRRGVLVSFAAAFVQAASAILIVAVGAIVLKVTATTMTAATDWVEVVSYGAIAAVGAGLLWSKTFVRGHHHHHHGGEAETAGHGHHGHGAQAHEHHQAVAARGSVFQRAWSAILAVGVRPCSGAIIVLVFALSQGLFVAGVAAALIMAVGTGVTVAAIAALTVSARGMAVRLAGADSTVAFRLIRGLEIAAAGAILVMGLALLGGALSAGLPG